MAALAHSVATLFLGAILVGSVSAQQPRQSNSEFLRAKSRRFIDYQRDFLSFARESKGGDDWAIPSNLHTAASTISEYLFATRSFLEIYDHLSCPSDRANARSILRREFAYYAKQIDGYVDTVNLGLSYTRAPAVATSGTQMKEDLRELKAFFEAVTLK